MTQGPYADYILDARDVCSNCFRRIRVERVDPVMSRDGLRHELDSHYSRHQRNTTREHHDSDPEVTHCDATFCQCGIEGSHERLWRPDDVDRERFRRLLKRAVKTVEGKGVALRRKETIMYAIQHFKNDADADKAISAGMEAGIVAEVAAP
jgi:hypothetical protein